MSDLLYSEVEEDLRASVRDLFADKAAAASVLARTESAEPYDLKLWRTLAAELGTAGLHVPEELGGQGASTRELAVVLEELGRAVVPVPFLGSAVLATSALLACDSDESGQLLRRLAAGEAIGALAVTLSTWPGAEFPTAARADADGVLSGRIGLVADASVADVLVVPALGPDGPGLYAVEGATVTEATSLDLTRRLADVTVDGAAGRLLAGPDRAAEALQHALLVGAGLLASEQLGVAQWCLDETVGYVKQRYQFGRPVGSFQALKHRLADLYLELVTARAAARNAADALADGRDVAIAVAVAQSACASVAVHAAEEAIQLHGGIGMTWEHPAHLYLKRAKSDELALGTPGRHRAALAKLVDLPA
ncbi:acyl-CoA/acyl-ACP dehydrogenase [Amycolatopsis acidiphila]|uniref:Acyl-CoA dehydrogenase n=1 Tax=Amycolatopsis acidiphila TaxID=715473 RepID=A0A558A2Z0_9PSEU|nr:acyl-CoA dehydrogenase family protein [Amycolatopsis acidiphila]TVT18635.1 acyl-CoA dehydrogenase [Amycolatopsis acidiphila]UIJ56617.1 acyl-CoA/acyl-ACP dehydrogenase [Amycolatopsis acidiphila]GHG66344.1 acyl-CoA dehydrogenase [Amycolatopsis acidiphila]